MKKALASKYKALKKVKAAVLLHGCGLKDGSDIMEVSSLLIALSQVQATVQCFAPDKPQACTVNHVTGQIEEAQEGEQRNMREEAARITGGNVESLDKLKAKNFDVLFVTGGMGVSRSLTDFSESVEDM